MLITDIGVGDQVIEYFKRIGASHELIEVAFNFIGKIHI